MTIKVGIIGAGFIAQKGHLSAYSRLKNVELIGVSDIDRTEAKSAARKYKCKSYVDYKTLVDKNDLDAISVCTPPFIRREVIEYAAEKGVSILCEKPMADSYASAKQIYEVIEKYGTQFMIGFNLRFTKWYQQAFEIIEDGKLGEIVFLTGMYAGSFPQRRSWVLHRGSGVIFDRGSHAIDISTWFLGFPKKVEAISLNKREMDVEENAFITLDHGNAISQLALSSGVNKPMNRLGVYGTACNLIVDEELLSLFFLPASEYMIMQSFPRIYINALRFLLSKKGVIKGEDSYLEQISYFINCVESGCDISPSHKEGLVNMRIIDACYESIKRGGLPISIENPLKKLARNIHLQGFEKSKQT